LQNHKTHIMRIKQLLFLGLLFSGSLLCAQTDFRPGFVIMANSDTVTGEIDYRGDLLMGQNCRFRKNEKEKEIVYTPNDINAYRFKNSKYFVSKDVKGKKVFLEFLLEGKINIYYLRNYEGNQYFLEKEGMEIIEIPYDEGIKYVDHTPYFYNTTRHIGLLNYYMQDAPDFQSRIAKIGKPEHVNLIKLAKDYHNLVCKERACIVYEKKIPLLKFNIEVAGGVVNYRKTDNTDNKNHFQAGVLMNFWMPRINEKLYFRTGLLYSTLEVNEIKESLYKIPIQIEYMYPRGIVRPTMALGVNIYSPIYQSLAMMGGINIQVHKSISLGIKYNADFNPSKYVFLIPKSFLSQSILFGVTIK
jgi:hypothetical protein